MPEPVNLTPDEPFTQHALQSENSGITLLYDTITGVPSRVLKYLVSGTLRKKRADGSYVFTLIPPANPPLRGSHRCLLHVDEPNHTAYMEMGLPTCRKANLPNLFQVEQHMAHRHRVESATIQRMEERAAQERRREYEQRMHETMLSHLNPNLHHETCPHCGDDFSAGVKVAAMNKRDAHVRAAHPVEKVG